MQRLKQYMLALFITIAVITTSGCGQKGGLYLPNQTQPSHYAS